LHAGRRKVHFRSLDAPPLGQRLSPGQHRDATGTAVGVRPRPGSLCRRRTGDRDAPPRAAAGILDLRLMDQVRSGRIYAAVPRENPMNRVTTNDRVTTNMPSAQKITAEPTRHPCGYTRRLDGAETHSD